MSLKRLADVFWCWIDCVAVSLGNRIDSIRRLRHVRLTEEETNSFKLELVSSGKGASVVVERIRMAEGRVVGVPSQQAEVALRGSQVELVLRSDRFLLRRLDLPKQAGEFLHGIIRSQLDRLTPWDATHAAFGWSAPVDIGNGRIALTVIATARALLSPYIEGLSNLGARLIIVSTIPRGADLDDAPIEILRHNGTGATNISIVRHALAAVLVLAALSMGLATTAELIASGLDAEKSDIMRRVAERRLTPAGDKLRSALSAQILERRKHETPSSVIVLDALSQILPDHTYATELRLEGDRLQVVGITRDAPSLISLLEQSAHFSRATFFAPTTRSPDVPGERFHIEARIRPAFTVQR
ncbi:MAG TPA: PilN domain-containing protein [Pseudolabrys sp.]|nr:PilN domain-containing protein [Pseudolabrys sp.]